MLVLVTLNKKNEVSNKVPIRRRLYIVMPNALWMLYQCPYCSLLYMCRGSLTHKEKDLATVYATDFFVLFCFIECMLIEFVKVLCIHNDTVVNHV